MFYYVLFAEMLTERSTLHFASKVVCQRFSPWDFPTTYVGHMAGLCSTTLSYKNKRFIRRPESKRILVENTHEPLISQELWDIVQEVRQHKCGCRSRWAEYALGVLRGLRQAAVLHRVHTETPKLTPKILRLFIQRIKVGEHNTPALPNRRFASSTVMWVPWMAWSR